MPIIDLLGHYGPVPEALTVRPPGLDQAKAYADAFGVEILCLTSNEATTDLDGGNAHLGQVLGSDKRFRGWLTLSVHQPDQSLALARNYLTRSLWIGARFEQRSDSDAVNSGGGHEVLNALRRYGRPVLLTVSTPGTLHAAIAAAREFTTLRFIVVPQNEDLTSDVLPAIKETLNILWMPSAAYAERDAVAHAVAIIGERRVLWASDWGRYHPAAAAGMIKDSAINNAQRERIVYRNAKDILPD